MRVLFVIPPVKWAAAFSQALPLVVARQTAVSDQFAAASPPAAAAAPTPGLSEAVGGVTSAMLPDPPKSGAVPPAGISDPIFDQTLQWMTETAPQNPDPETGERYAYPMFVVPASTCSKTGFVTVGYHDGKEIRYDVTWLPVDFGRLDPAMVIASGRRVSFGSSAPHIGVIAPRVVHGLFLEKSRRNGPRPR
jgi:hypothetical protein